MKHVLRYHIRKCTAQSSIADIKKYCERTGCREVLLFTSSYDFQPSFIPLDQLKSYADSLAGWSKELNQAGITVNINVLQTLGHINFPLSVSEAFPFQRRVDWRGLESTGGACPLDRRLGEYVADVYRIFAELKPPVIYVDDDFRSLIGGQCCFCQQHLEQISQLLGQPISREKLCDEMLKTDSSEPNKYRKAFQQSQVRGLCELGDIIRRAVDEVSPETRIGLMVAITPRALWGHDYSAVSEVLAGKKHRPLVRPQMHPYMENDDLHKCAGDFRQPAIVRELYRGEIDVQPEIENYPYTTYAKSAQLTLLQMVTPQLDGCHEDLLDIFDMYGSPFSQSEAIVKMLEENKGLFRELTRIIPEGHRSEGIALWQHPGGHLYYRLREKTSDLSLLLPDRKAEEYISLLGLPVGFEWQKSPFLMLCGDDVAALDKAELASLLERNAILDLPAMERVIEKGLGDIIGLQLGQPITADQSTAEMFVDEKFCGKHVGKYSPLKILVKDNWARPITPLNGTSLKPLSFVVNHKGEKICPAVSAIETRTGRRFGTLSFALNDVCRHMFVTARRCVQMRNLIEWTAGKKLPIVTSEHAFLVPQYLTLPNGDAIFALGNYSPDATDGAILEINVSSLSGITRLTSDGAWKDACGEFEQLSNGSFVLKRSVRAYEVLVYRLPNTRKQNKK